MRITKEREERKDEILDVAEKGSFAYMSKVFGEIPIEGVEKGNTNSGKSEK